MKDAKGHGSDARGMASAATAGNHQAGVLRLGRPSGAIIQNRDTALPGWRNVMRTDLSKSLVRPEAKAERIAMRMRADNKRYMPVGSPDIYTRVRVR